MLHIRDQCGTFTQTTCANPYMTLPCRGFSLIELMVALGIIALLAAFALPAYQSYVMRARRADATSMLYQVQQSQIRYRGFNAGYASNMTTLGLSASSPENYYNITTGLIASGFYVVAKPASGSAQLKDSVCQTIRLEQVNANTPQTPEACWK
ncbi:type IV pilin protein [Vogesella fluminis]|uniref:type IV pilin protein n=1 Tax=Vogesella fluminis TaxID=1069161 RepID=UPI0027E532B1|nr:type IV pilin protein [Vogesella fluminis]